MASRADSIHGLASVSLKETLIAAGLAPELANLLDEMPHRSMQVDPRRPFREPGIARSRLNANVMRDALVRHAVVQNSWPKAQIAITTVCDVPEPRAWPRITSPPPPPHGPIKECNLISSA